MRFVNGEAPSDRPRANGQPSVAEVLYLKDRDGNVLKQYTKNVDGSLTEETVSVTAAVARVVTATIDTALSDDDSVLRFGGLRITEGVEIAGDDDGTDLFAYLAANLEKIPAEDFVDNEDGSCDITMRPGANTVPFVSGDSKLTFADTVTGSDAVAVLSSSGPEVVSAAIAAALSTAVNRARVRAATTGNVTIATALNNGDTLDGVTLATGDLVLVKDQSTKAQNGVYVVGATPARDTQFDTLDEHPGSMVIVEEGTANEDTVWYCTADKGGVLGTDDIDFAQFPSSVSDTAYNESSWNGVTTVAPSKNAVRDKFEALDAAKLNAASVLRGYVASDVTYNNTAALATVAGMSVTVVDGGIYAINLVVQSTNAVKGLNMDFAGTVTPANFIGEWHASKTDGDEAEPQRYSKVTAIGTDFAPNAFDATDSIFTFTGSLEVTTGGTFLLRGAQNAADASNTVILRGSSMILTKLN